MSEAFRNFSKIDSIVRRIGNRIIALFFSAATFLLFNSNYTSAKSVSIFEKNLKKNRFLEQILFNRSFRTMLDQMQPRFLQDINGVESLPSLTVIIPCHPKDFSLIQSVIDGLIANSLNPIQEILIITPQEHKPEVKSKVQIRFLEDDNLLDLEIVKLMKSEFSNENSGWIRQQIIKIRAVMIYVSTKYALVLDSDTVLLGPRIFATDQFQELSFAREYHEPYYSHVKRFNSSIIDTSLSFVTHYQVWNTSLVNEIWGGMNLIKWIEARDRAQTSCISEYQTYGQFMISNHPNSYRSTRWGNAEFSRKVQDNFGNVNYLDLKKRFPKNLSVSIHSYS